MTMIADRLDQGYRSLDATVHDIDDANHTVAVDFPHEVIDSYNTDWGKRCWDESFSRRLPAMVWNHNPDQLIGIGVRGEYLGHASRLVGKFADFDDVPKAREAYSMIRDHIVPGWSFHFRNARSIPHPDVRGARRFVKADMLEFSPVTFPTIPGAQAVGLRSEEAAVATLTIDQILSMQEKGLIDEEGVRALIGEHFPDLRDHIRVPAPRLTVEGAREALSERYGEEALRHLVIQLPSETGATENGSAGPDDGDDAPDEESAQLAEAIDAALDAAQALIDKAGDRSALPQDVQQVYALVQAAGTASDELLEVMGLDDPDRGERSDKYSAEELRRLLSEGHAIKNPEGEPSYPIEDTDDLDKAIHAVGRGKSGHDDIRRYIIKRAGELGQSSKIPADWNTDGSLKDGQRSEEPESDLEGELVSVLDRLGSRSAA